MCRNAIHDTSNSSGPISRSTRQSPAPPMVGSVHARDRDPQGVRAAWWGCGERGQRGGAGSRCRLAVGARPSGRVVVLVVAIVVLGGGR
jgi:hypothetical protein